MTSWDFATKLDLRQLTPAGQLNILPVVSAFRRVRGQQVGQLLEHGVALCLQLPQCRFHLGNTPLQLLHLRTLRGLPQVFPCMLHCPQLGGQLAKRPINFVQPIHIDSTPTLATESRIISGCVLISRISSIFQPLSVIKNKKPLPASGRGEKFAVVRERPDARQGIAPVERRLRFSWVLVLAW